MTMTLPPAPEVLPNPRPPRWYNELKVFGFVMSDDEYLVWLEKNVQLDLPPGRPPRRTQLVSTAESHCSSAVMNRGLGLTRLVWPNDEELRKRIPTLRLFAFATGTNRSEKDLERAYDVQRIRDLARFLGKDEDVMPQWYSFSPMARRGEPSRDEREGGFRWRSMAFAKLCAPTAVAVRSIEFVDPVLYRWTRQEAGEVETRRDETRSWLPCS